MLKVCLGLVTILYLVSCSSSEETQTSNALNTVNPDFSVVINNIVSDNSNTAVDFTIKSNYDYDEQPISVEFWANRFNPIEWPRDQFTQDCSFKIIQILKGDNRFVRICHLPFSEGKAYLMARTSDLVLNNFLSPEFLWSGGLDQFYYLQLYSDDNSRILVEVYRDPTEKAFLSNQTTPNAPLILTYLHITDDPMYVKVTGLNNVLDFTIDYDTRLQNRESANRRPTIIDLDRANLVLPGQSVAGRVSAGESVWIQISGF